jgi:hypothetical protein
MNAKKLLILLPVIATLTGCVTARATMLTPDRYEPVHEDAVTVFLNATEVPESCVRIALIHASGDPSVTNERQMITAAKRRAGKIGANAILLSEIRDPRMDTRVAAEIFGVPADRKGEMLGYRCPDAPR